MTSKGAVIITAAGSSSRMKGMKKEYCPLPSSVVNTKTEKNEKPLTVLGAAARTFAASARISLIVFTVPPGGESEARSALPPDLACKGNEPLFVSGGPRRRVSVHNALSLLEKYHPSWVLIHDGARPWVKADLIEKIIDAVFQHGAAIPLLPLVETPKEGDFSGPGGTGFITRHLKRSQVGTAQTPQGFAFPEILRAHEKAAERESRDKIEYTDDAEVWGEFIGPVAIIPGDPENRKITFPEDLEV